MYVWGSGNGGRWSGMCEGCSLRSPVCNILILGGGALCAAGKIKDRVCYSISVSSSNSLLDTVVLQLTYS